MPNKKNVTLQDWIDGKKPFDFASCGHCLSRHAQVDCGVKAHAAMGRGAKRLGLHMPTTGLLRKVFDETVRLRERFDRFYPTRAGK